MNISHNILNVTNRVLFLIFLFLLLLGQLQRITPTIYLHDLVLVVWLIHYIAQKLLSISWKPLLESSKKTYFSLGFTFKKNLRSPVFVSLLLLIFWVLIGWFWHWSTQGFDWIPLLYTLRLGVYLVSLWTFYRYVDSQKELSSKRIDFIGTVFFLVLILIGWIQWLLIPDIRWLAILGWDDHYYRMVGTQFDPNYWGILLVFAWSWFAYTSFGAKSLYLFTIITAFTLVFTWSRASYVAFATILITTLFTLKNVKKIYVPAVISITLVLSSLLLVPKPSGEGGNLLRTSTITSRIDNTTQSITTLTTPQLLLGTGVFVPNNMMYTEHFTRPNNAKFPTSFPSFVLTGIGIGGITLVSITLCLFFNKKTNQSRRVNILEWIKNHPATTTSLIAVGVHSLFNLSILQPFILLILGVILIGEKIKKKI